MKRLHVNLAVDDLDTSIGFYTSLFASEPTVLKEDYAKWMLDDPRVNFAITTRGQRKGIDHLGIQVENEAELDEVYSAPENHRRTGHRRRRNNLLLCQFREELDFRSRRHRLGNFPDPR